IDPLGVTVAAAGEGPGLIFAEISAHRGGQVREQLPVLKNRRFAAPELF
ncbi:hydrolase, partial [Klebsiella pneumoniae]|nr:hydrolase [Klebsiella pneumoniae]